MGHILDVGSFDVVSIGHPPEPFGTIVIDVRVRRGLFLPEVSGGQVGEEMFSFVIERNRPLDFSAEDQPEFGLVLEWREIVLPFELTAPTVVFLDGPDRSPVVVVGEVARAHDAGNPEVLGDERDFAVDPRNLFFSVELGELGDRVPVVAPDIHDLGIAPGSLVREVLVLEADLEALDPSVFVLDGRHGQGQRSEQENRHHQRAEFFQNTLQQKICKIAELGSVLTL